MATQTFVTFPRFNDDSGRGRYLTASRPFSLQSGTHKIDLEAGFNPTGTVSIEKQVRVPVPGVPGHFKLGYEPVPTVPAFEKSGGGKRETAERRISRFVRGRVRVARLSHQNKLAG